MKLLNKIFKKKEEIKEEDDLSFKYSGGYMDVNKKAAIKNGLWKFNEALGRTREEFEESWNKWNSSKNEKN